MANKNIAISFENVSKMYRLGLVGTGTLGQDLNRWWKMNVLHQEDPYLKVGQTNDRSTKGESDFVYALQDINFQVEQGDVVGIIGKNGAGKSTLLKLLSRITAPTTGQIKTKGRLASLLEVGTGFHPELTGRENIYMNGSIMGMRKAEITRKLDEIIDFAGVARYIDTPCKRYSSGMQVRLGFAVAAFLEPEILVVDEVLAVGDAEFQKKAIGKMQDVSTGEGRTVLFVSHNMNSVRLLCKNGIVLKNGMVEYTGTADQCVDYYVGSNIVEIIPQAVIEKKHRWYEKKHDVEFLEARIVNDNPAAMASDEPLIIELTLKVHFRNHEEMQYSAVLVNDADICVANYTSDPIALPQQDLYKVRLEIKNHALPAGKYMMHFSVGHYDFYAGSTTYDDIRNVLSFEVKYQDLAQKKEFLSWNSRWGLTYHNGKDIEARVVV